MNWFIKNNVNLNIFAESTRPQRKQKKGRQKKETERCKWGIEGTRCGKKCHPNCCGLCEYDTTTFY